MGKNRKRNKNQNRADPMNYSHSGGSSINTALADLFSGINTPEEDIEENKEVLMGRSRQLAMGNALAISALKKIRTNVIGSGLKLKASIPADILGINEEEAEKIERKLETLWEYWAESTECDYEGQMNFYQIQSLVILTKLRDGECFVGLPFRKNLNDVFELKLRVLDSALCVNPSGSSEKVMNGVESDSQGVPIAYHFRKNYKSMDTVRISKYGSLTGRQNILVLMERERAGQKRGVPLLSPVMEELHQVTKVRRAELKNILVSTIFSVFVTSPDSKSTLKLKKDFNSLIDEKNEVVKLGSGTISVLPPGVKIEQANPNRQCASLDSFITSIAKNIGACLEIPYEVLMSSFNSSYSASRAALNEAWRTYMLHREWHIAEFCKPVYAEFLDYIVDSGIIELPGYKENLLIKRAYQGSEWFGSSVGQIDPSKEAKAAEIRLRCGLTSLTRETKLLTGADYETVLKQRRKEAQNELELNELKRKAREVKGGGENVMVESGKEKK